MVLHSSVTTTSVLEDEKSPFSDFSTSSKVFDTSFQTQNRNKDKPNDETTDDPQQLDSAAIPKDDSKDVHQNGDKFVELSRGGYPFEKKQYTGSSFPHAELDNISPVQNMIFDNSLYKEESRFSADSNILEMIAEERRVLTNNDKASIISSTDITSKNEEVSQY